MSSRRNVSLTVGANLGLSVVNVVTGVALARLLGPENRGQLAAVMLWGVTLGGFAAVGVPDAIVYYVARRPEDSGRTVASAAALNLLTAAAFTLVFWFVVPMLLGRQDEQTKDLARLFLLVIPLYVIAGVPANALRGRSSFIRWNLVRFQAPVLWLLTIGIAYFTNNLTVAFLTTGFLASQAIVLVVSSVIALPVVSRPLRIEPSRWGTLLRFGLPGVLSSVPAMANLRLDQMLLAAFVSNESLGLYVTGVAWAGVLSPVLSAMGAVLFPRIAGESEHERRIEVLGRGLRMSVLVASVLAVVVAIATPIGIRVLFGVEYAAAVPAAAILVAAGAVLAVNGVIEDSVRGLGHPSEVLWAEIGGLVGTVALLAALLPPFGIVGAAIASVGGYLVTTAILLVRLNRSEKLPKRFLLPGRPELAELKALALSRFQ